MNSATAYLLNVLVSLKVHGQNAWPELRNGRHVPRKHAEIARGGGDGNLVHLK